MNIFLSPAFVIMTAGILLQLMQVIMNLWSEYPLLTDETSTEIMNFWSNFPLLTAGTSTEIMNLWSNFPLLPDGTSTETETKTAVTRNLNNVLESHPRCGITSGGREECWWGCDRKPVGPGYFGSSYFTVILRIENYQIK